MNKLRIGDVFSVKTSRGIAHFQYTHRNKLLGYCIRVFHGFNQTENRDVGIITKNPHYYFTFIFRQDFFESPLIQFVGNCKLPKNCIKFPLFRAGIVDPSTGKVENWWLWEGKEAWRINEIPEDFFNLPVREIWSDNILIDRIENEWRPTLYR